MMLTRRELSGWWGQIKERPGWSYDVAKRKWMVLQAMIPASLVMAVGIPASFYLGWLNLDTAIVGALCPAVAFVIMDHGRWDRDRQQSEADEARAFE